jgi:hypothetical protein
MGFCGAPLFRKRQFAAEIIVTCVRWYLRFSLSLRDVEELIAERGFVSRPYNRVAMDPEVCPEGAAAIARAGQAERIDLAHR